MKKILSALILLQFFVLQSFSQNAPEEYNSIQEFIESTVQIPFMARVADVQGAVRVRITMGIDSLPVKYEVTQSLRPDCDLEALRVVKLINSQNLRKQVQNKNIISIEVPFDNKEKIKFEDGYLLDYFNEDKKIAKNENEIKFVRKYLVDSLTGIIKNNAEYFEVKKNNLKRIGSAFSIIDSTEISIPTLFENVIDSVKIYKFSEISTGGFPKKYFESYQNGQIRFKEVDNKSLYYYPNGRIKAILEAMVVDSENVIREINWFANGQVAFIKTYVKNQPEDPQRFILVCDTLGNKIVENGEGLAEFYDRISIEKGAFKNGYKDGIWIKKSLNGMIDFKEIYDQSNLLEGISYVGSDSIKYDIVRIKASFKGGIKEFGKHLMTTLKYPRDAVRSGMQGTVFVEFTVCTDGTLCDYNILRGVDESFNTEALRVIKLTNGKWNSGKSRGVPIKTRYTLPISFQSLGVINR